LKWLKSIWSYPIRTEKLEFSTHRSLRKNTQAGKRVTKTGNRKIEVRRPSQLSGVTGQTAPGCSKKKEQVVETTCGSHEKTLTRCVNSATAKDSYILKSGSDKLTKTGEFSAKRLI